MKPTKPNVRPPLTAGVRLAHTALIELFVPPLLKNAPPIDGLNHSDVTAGAAPLGVTTTAKVRLSILTPIPNDRANVHRTLLPGVARFGHVRLTAFCPHDGAAINRPASSRYGQNRMFVDETLKILSFPFASREVRHTGYYRQK